MTDWASLVEEQIREAMARGEFANLPGEGKPLKLDDNPYTPEHLRLAYRLLRDNGFAPEWMMLGQELEQKRAQLLNNVQRAIRAYRGALGDADRLPDPQAAAERRRRADSAWRLACNPHGGGGTI